MSNAVPFGQWEKRWHPLRREWVVYAAHRNNRPWNFDKQESVIDAPEYDPTCYLCPGNLRVSGKRNPDPYEVFIFENDHPVVGPNAPDIPAEFISLHEGLYKRDRAKGIAKVVCYDPRHNVTLNEVSVEQVAKVFKALQQEMKEFEANKDIKSVLIFENKGELVGVSNPHPHCQIYAADFEFNLMAREMEAAQEHLVKTGRNLFADIIEAEQKDDIRIIAENKNAIAFIPFFARYAYETYVFPKKRHSTIITMTDEEIFDLAETFQTVTRKFDANFNSSFPYVLVFSQAPVDGGNYSDFHMHLILCPPLRQPGLQKFLGGPERGADTFMADTMPEEKAAELRKIKL